MNALKPSQRDWGSITATPSGGASSSSPREGFIGQCTPSYDNNEGDPEGIQFD
ncbi:MAG: hypothetical protein VYE04_01845 [Pseudomonadota bacterium]|nr:hypothetical protein [Pseudomonadota bacterium]